MSADLLARAEAARPGITQEARDVAMKQEGCVAGLGIADHRWRNIETTAASRYPFPTVTLPGEPVEVDAEREDGIHPSRWRASSRSSLGVEEVTLAGVDGYWRPLKPVSPAQLRAAAKALDAATQPVTVRVVWHDGVARAEVVA